MGVADNEYISVPTGEPVEQQQQQQQPQQPTSIVYGAPQSYYPHQQAQIILSAPTTTTPAVEETPVCCDRCELESKVKIQRYSIVGPWLFQVIFLFFSVEFYIFSIAPILGLFAMYTQNRCIVALHFLTAAFYYVFSVIFLITANQSNTIFLSILFSIIFSLSLINYGRYIKTLNKLAYTGECLQSNNGSAFEITIESQPTTTTVQTQQPTAQPQPIYISQLPTMVPQQQQPQVIVPQIVYDANHNPIYHLIPIQNNNQN
ncbi:hypothetical protein RB653_000159 [Dictyostelium firmibasis]|uniref:Uncharacterized protein n=1 Tax=Dictyostelium firmibasis TaxID=79012 RepID=A0AAN7YVP8_9MYCE